LSDKEPAFGYSNEFLTKLLDHNYNKRITVLALSHKVNNHEANATQCGDDKFFTFNDICKVYFDRVKWEFTNFEFKP